MMLALDRTYIGKPANLINRNSLHLNPQGKRNVGRHKYTPRRELETEINYMGQTFKELQELESDRQFWRALIPYSHIPTG